MQCICALDTDYEMLSFELVPHFQFVETYCSLLLEIARKQVEKQFNM